MYVHFSCLAYVCIDAGNRDIKSIILKLY